MPKLVKGDLRIPEMTEDETGRVIPFIICQAETVCPTSLIATIANNLQRRYPHEMDERLRSLGRACRCAVLLAGLEDGSLLLQSVKSIRRVSTIT